MDSIIRTIVFLCCLPILFASPVLALNRGDVAPSFALRDSNDASFYFSDHLGPKKKKATKGIVLSFFASYCEPCKRELPMLNALVDELDKKGIKVVIVGFNEDFDAFGDILAKLKVDKPIILSDKYGKVGQKYGVTHLPVTFFIGLDGRVREVVRGEMTDPVLRDRIEKLLQ